MQNDHQTWLGKIFQKPFNEVKDFIGSIFTKKTSSAPTTQNTPVADGTATAPANDTKHSLLTVAIGITEAIKNFILSPAVDAATALIPSNVDDDIVAWLRKNLPIILGDAIAFQGINKDSSTTDIQTVLSKVVDEFGGLPDEKKQKFYTSVGADVYQLLLPLKTGEKITWGESAKTVEEAYQAFVELKNQP